MMEDFEMYADALINWGIASEDEIDLVCMINGWNTESLCDILYARTGYKNFKQYAESEGMEL